MKTDQQKVIEKFLETCSKRVVGTIDNVAGVEQTTSFEFRRGINIDGAYVTLKVFCEISPAGGTPGAATAGGYDEDGNAPAATPEMEDKDKLIAAIKDLGGEASRRMNVSTLQEKLAELQAKPEPEPEPEEDEFGLGEPEVKAPMPTLEDVKDRLFKVMETQGKEAVAKILKGIKCSKVSEIPDDQYADVIATANKILKD